MSAPYSGGCACGAISLQISGEPVGTRQCWCRQCQQIASGGPTHNAMFKTEDVTITGTLSSSAWTAASGNTLTFHFCPACGTQIYGQSSARPQFRTMRFGALDADHGLRPQAAIWTEDAPDWAVFDPAMEQFPRQPPPPAPKD